ncbi:glycosyltransferase [Pannonibacter tanglangensis]|uniref:Glycosyltransferase n=1 Tax=Pannonibacter tanglangensis TaxID=2750084 RepID=A0ABW9ZC25_9HYPH|nr:glycosyltransferase [Pannonibacter sp. XCT-34]NBN62395.1 glycosyltransferase [Pannonibacter sp. XCT-34]
MTLYKSDDLAYFELALRSIENQTGLEGPIRIYICCDGPLPTAHSKWLDENRHRFYRVEKNEANLGLAASLNKLIEGLGDEDFVFRMDGDDISHSDRFIKQIGYMLKNPHIGLCGCFAWDIDEQGATVSTRDYPIGPDKCKKALRLMNPVLHPTFCIRREVLRDPQFRYPKAYLTEDLAFLIVLAEHGIGITNIPERLFSWRLGKGFFARRTSFKRALTELRWYSRGVRANDGVMTYRYIYPVIRFLLRILPAKAQKAIYASKARSTVVAQQDRSALE